MVFVILRADLLSTKKPFAADRIWLALGLAWNILFNDHCKLNLTTKIKTLFIHNHHNGKIKSHKHSIAKKKMFFIFHKLF